jgi:putative spermidine/putrescine transport system substrate-binding protein
MVAAETLPHLPTATDNMKTALIADPNFWGDRGEELREKFTAWLAN